MISRKEYKLVSHDNNNPAGLCYWTIEGVQGIWYEGWSKRLYEEHPDPWTLDDEEQGLKDLVSILNIGGGYFEKPTPTVDES